MASATRKCIKLKMGAITTSMSKRTLGLDDGAGLFHGMMVIRAGNPSRQGAMGGEIIVCAEVCYIDLEKPE